MVSNPPLLPDAFVTPPWVVSSVFWCKSWQFRVRLFGLVTYFVNEHWDPRAPIFICSDAIRLGLRMFRILHLAWSEISGDQIWALVFVYSFVSSGSLALPFCPYFVFWLSFVVRLFDGREQLWQRGCVGIIIRQIHLQHSGARGSRRRYPHHRIHGLTVVCSHY